MARDAERRCFNCGAGTLTGRVEDICGCGLASAARRYPFRCVPNPTRSAANPAEVVIVRKEARAPDIDHTRPRKAAP